MVRRAESLIDQIQTDALDDAVPVATALRKCIVLGGQSGSEALRDWATRELQGYEAEADLPPYRVVLAPLMVDAVSGRTQITVSSFLPRACPSSSGMISPRPSTSARASETSPPCFS
jgi:AbiTii